MVSFGAHWYSCSAFRMMILLYFFIAVCDMSARVYT